MRGQQATVSLLSAAALISSATAQAPLSTGNPPDAIYKATVDQPFFAGAVLPGQLKASITAQAPADGQGVKFDVHFENLPTEGGPFTYHLHVNPSVDGNCTTTLAHLDPFAAGVAVKCNPNAPETCEVGDLAGKHGAVTADPWEVSYVDQYASTKEGDASFFGNRSFVLHYANSTRLACANFEKQVTPVPTDGNTTAVASPTTSGVATSTGGGVVPSSTESPPPFSGVGQLSSWSVSVVFAGAVAVMFGL